MTNLYQLVAARVPLERAPELTRRLDALPGFTRVPLGIANWVVVARRVAGEAPLPAPLPGAPGALVVEGPSHPQVHAPERPSFERWSALLGPLSHELGVVQFAPDGASLVRSVGGLVPLYHAQQDDLLLVSTTLTELVGLLDRAPAPDFLVHAAWTGFTCEYPFGRTFFEGVRVLPPGHFASLRPGSDAITTRYWDPSRAPRAVPGHEVEQEHARQLRDLLIRSVREEFPRDGSGLLWLSGGVDSSSLAALVEREGAPYSTLSLIPEESGPIRSREMGYIESASPNAVKHHLFGFDAHRYAEVPALAPLRLVHCLHPALPRTLSLSQEHAYRCAMGGEFADEVCGGQYSSPDSTRDTSLRSLGSLVLGRQVGVKSVARWAKHLALRGIGRPIVPAAAELSPCFSHDTREEYLEYRRTWQRQVLEDRQTNSTLFSLLLGTEFMSMSWEVLAPAGVHRLLPFVGRAIYEWALATHPRERFDPGTKRLLRLGLTGLVGRRNLQRLDKGSFGPIRKDIPMARPEVPSQFEPLFDTAWLDKSANGGMVSIHDRTVVAFLVVFDQALRRARTRPLG